MVKMWSQNSYESDSTVRADSCDLSAFFCQRRSSCLQQRFQPVTVSHFLLACPEGVGDSSPKLGRWEFIPPFASCWRRRMFWVLAHTRREVQPEWIKSDWWHSRSKRNNWTLLARRDPSIFQHFYISFAFFFIGYLMRKIDENRSHF